MDNYRTIEHKLRNLEPFRGNSLTGQVDSYGTLRVWSYDTHIGTAWPSDNGVLVTVFDEYRYTATTTRHQKLIRKAWGI
jgi:hypothetical protein